MTRSIRAVVSLGSTVGLVACGGGIPVEPSPSNPSPVVSEAAVVPACTGTSAWSTLGHDARRSSASDGCAWYPLRKLWEYAPVAGVDRSVQGMERAIADTAGVYVTWNSNPTHVGSAGSPAIDKVAVDTGVRVWSVDRLLNDNRGHWPSFFTYEKNIGGNVYETRQGVLRNDDGARLWSQQFGANYYSGGTIPYAEYELSGNDSWGQSLSDGTRLWLNNQYHLHGPKLGLRSFDKRGVPLLELNTYGYYGGTRVFPLHQWDTAEDRLGSIATDNGFIYLAAIYNFQCSTNCDPNQPRPFATGLYGWDLATGAQRWNPVSLEPASHISVATNRIYLLERDLATGAVTFNIRNGGYNGASLYRSAPFPSSQITGYQAPVLVGGRAIVAAQESSGANPGTVLYSFDALSGGTPLTMTLPGVYDVIVPWYGRDLLDFSTTPYAGKRTTSIAAASGTKDASGNSVPTLVIASRTGLHVIAVSTLTTLWSATKQALVGTSEGGALRDPIIVKDRVYVADRNKLYALGL
ncbi:hypothetical protein LZ198_08180 [Myxococcus sp. K15C18031901]|uniref:hypothetical protein n=1 Tax=Myxococcus dinghuensis TaxID=2906761 RepID=UPI0020A7C6C1|nr:hypothetical protein [Myxococcus dinghuensis]MCP3098850.1 hypothetical protein [Myxococcus dinghuensis]